MSTEKREYTIIHATRVGEGAYSSYVPAIKIVNTKDIKKYVRNTDLDVYFVFEGNQKPLDQSVLCWE